MALRMTRPTRRKDSTVPLYRKRVPKDVVAKARGEGVTIRFPRDGEHKASSVTVRIADEVKLSLRTRDPSVAKARSGLVEDQLRRAWEAIRSGPRKLNHKEIVALAGTLYRDFAEAFEDDPRGAERWQKVQRDNAEAIRGDWAKLSLRIPVASTARERTVASLAVRFGPLVDAVLARESLVVDDKFRDALLLEAGRALTDAAAKLERNAKGDYAPDPKAARFPQWQDGHAATSNKGLTLSSIYAGWEKSARKRELAPSTFRDYESRWRMFVKWLGHNDATRVSPDNIVAYKNHRLDSGLSIKTVNSSDLNAIKAIFAWAVDDRMLTANPAQGIRAKGKRKTRERELHFKPDEIAGLLRLAKGYTRESARELETTAAAKRWLPWLCAYSGARIGEMAQLRKQDIVQEEGEWIIRLTPEADTMKDGVYRPVPIHADLIEQGFLKFVENAPQGYLWFRATKVADAAGIKKSLCNRLRTFVRGVVSDKRVNPNHGWRHTFKARALEADLSDKVADALCGHGAKSVADHYRAATLTARIRFMKRFPKYEL